MPDIIYEKRGNIAYVTMNRPQAMNALAPAQQEEMVRVWCDFRDEPDMWVAIITGTGERAFWPTGTPTIPGKTPIALALAASPVAWKSGNLSSPRSMATLLPVVWSWPWGLPPE